MSGSGDWICLVYFLSVPVPRPSVPVSCLVLVDCESVAVVLSIKGQAIIISCYYILLW